MGTVLTADRLFDGRSVVDRGAVLIEGDEVRYAGPVSKLPATDAGRREFGDATIEAFCEQAREIIR